MPTVPNQVLEQSLHAQGHSLVAGMDEAGRGALAGPVTVGIAIVDAGVGPPPAGLTDSKLLSPAARNRLVEPVRTWARASATGHATPAEIDRYGIIGALCLAGHRALAAATGNIGAPAVILLDGIHDWMSIPPPCHLPCPTPAVITQVKGDLRVAAIAAASILAKTERDALMERHHEDYPDYGWASNKGYGAAAHTDAIRRLGPSPLHRTSWNLPTGPEPIQDSLLG